MLTFYSELHLDMYKLAFPTYNDIYKIDWSPVLGPNQRKWVEMLRSGQFEQGRTYLKRDNKYCCLGVAEAMFCRNEIEDTGPSTLDPIGVTMFSLNLVNEMGEMTPGVNRCSDAGHLYRLNDQYNKTFEEIADTICRYPRLYFYGPK